MANLESVIANIPGLAGYQAQDQMNRGNEMQSVQQASAAMNLANLIKQRQLGQQFAGTFGDGNDQQTQAMKLLAQTNPGALAELIAKNKMAQDLSQSEFDRLGIGQSAQPTLADVAQQQPPQPPQGPVGAFQGDPKKILSDIARISDPQERAGALQAFTQQMQQSPTQPAQPTAQPSMQPSGTLAGMTPEKALAMSMSPVPAIAKMGAALMQHYDKLDQQKQTFEANAGLRRELQDNQITATKQMHDDTIAAMKQNQSGYTSIQPDGAGGFIGLNKRTNQIEKVPQSADTVGANDSIKTTAQAIAEGRLAPLTGWAATKPLGQQIMSEVMRINPNYNAKDFASGLAAEKGFTSGKQGNTVRSFNVAISHLDTLSQLTDALNNGDIQAVNKIGNYFSSQTGGTAPTNFVAAKKIVADEIVKAIVGSGGGVTDREEAAKAIQASNSPAQLKGVIDTYTNLMKGQLDGLEKQYTASTGKSDFSQRFLTPLSQARTSANSNQVTLPNGSVKTFPSGAAAAAFKKAAGL